MYGLIKSFSSFSPGLCLFLMTNNFMGYAENERERIIYLLVFLAIIYIISQIILNYFKNKEICGQISIVSIQPAEKSVIPIYIGLFVIFLELNSLPREYEFFLIIGLFIIWWKSFEKSYYFNLFWIFNYKYYEVVDIHGNKFTIYSKRKDFKMTQDKIEIKNPVRINNFTYLEK